MKKFVYPAVLFYDKTEKQYTIAMFDIEVFAEGKTVEEALNNLKEAIELYLENEEPVMPKTVLVTTLEVAIWVQKSQYYHHPKL